MEGKIIQICRLFSEALSSPPPENQGIIKLRGLSHFYQPLADNFLSHTLAERRGAKNRYTSFLSSANEVSTGPTCQFVSVCVFMCLSGLFFKASN